MAGLSLGEYTALVAAGALTFRDAIRVVGVRANAMQSAGWRNPGAMTTVKGLDDATLERYCAEAAAETGKVVQVANYLFPKCQVIAGDPDAVNIAAWMITRDGKDLPRRDKPTVRVRARGSTSICISLRGRRMHLMPKNHLRNSTSPFRGGPSRGDPAPSNAPHPLPPTHTPPCGVQRRSVTMRTRLASPSLGP